jgi:hypothetical protein
VKSPRQLVALLVVLMLATGASSASAVVVHLEDGATLSYQPAPGASAEGTGASPFDAFFTNLDFGGGPIMTSNTNYTFFWRPASATAYPPEYQAGVDTYFKDLEHDSTGHENVDSVATQYNNATGEFVKYESQFAGLLVDERPYPPNGCTRAPICLTDAQIRAELRRFIAEHGLPTDLNHEYFVLPPEGVESCFEESASAECSANVSEGAHQKFCAYHGAIGLVGGGEIVYSNDPFVNGKNCDEPTHHINGTSDSALFGGMSHEHVESITDPEPNGAWTDWGAFTGEIGDKCRTFVESSEFGTPLGEVPVGGENLKYNQEINGDKYWYQQEWSNKGHECLQRLEFKPSEAPAATFASAPVSGNQVKFDATGSLSGASVRYAWQFNDFAGHRENETVETTGLTLNHTFPSSGTYTVALTVFKPDGTSKGVAKQVFVNEKAQSITFESSSPGSAAVGGPSYSVSAKASSGLSVALTIDASSSSVCSITGSTVSFIGVGTCRIDADQAGNSEWEPAPRVQQSFSVAKGSQAINFTSSAPTAAVFQGSTYTVSATATSGLAAVVTIDPASQSVCSISGATVSFIGLGTCTIDVNQAGNSNYNAAAQAQQAFAVGKGAQTIKFNSTAPTAATVGGTSYTVAAEGGASKEGVTLTIDGSSASVCTISGTTVSFVGVGTCTIDANQAGNSNYNAAPQALQSFTVTAPAAASATLTTTTALILPLTAAPNSNFTTTSAFSQATGAITFKESVTEPGTFSWLVMFQNGKFGAFASSNTKCKTGFIKLSGKCRPAKIVFAKGSKAVTAAGTVIFTLKPSASALKALKNALKQRKGLPVTATLRFQSSLGGSPVSRTQSLTVKLRKK